MHVSSCFAGARALGALALGMFFAIAAASTAQDEPTTRVAPGEKWTLEGYQRSLKAMEQFFGEIEVEGNLRDEIHLRADSTNIDEARIVYCRTGGALKTERWNGNAAVVWCRNPQHYVFKALKTPVNPGFTLSERHPASFPVSDSKERYAFRCLDASHAIQGISISTLVDSSDFSVIAVEDETVDNARVVHITYSFAPKNETSILSDGELWLAPEKGWAVLKSVSQLVYRNSASKRTGRSVTEVRYQDELQDGIAIPSEVTISSNIGNFSRIERFVVTKFLHGKLDNSKFTLTAYSLPEIDDSTEAVQAPPRLRWIFAINLGVVIILAGVFVVRQALRWRRTHRGPVSDV